MHRQRSCSRVLGGFAALLAVGLASLDAVAATSAGSTPANSSVCQPHVTLGVLPVWARAGFSSPRPRMAYSLGRAGKIAALLFANPLRSPPSKTYNNKILWVSRQPSVRGPTFRSAPSGCPARGRSVLRSAAG